MESAVNTANSKNFNVHCHTHKRKKCNNSLNIEAQQQLVETIFQKQEEKWVKSVKKLVSDLKDEILTEISSSCALKNCSQSSNEDGSSTESTITETLAFPLTLSELEDSSEVEYDNVSIGSYKKYDDCDSLIRNKRKFSVEQSLSSKRQRSDDYTLEHYNYNTPTQNIYSSSPLRRSRVAKALSFSSCSESDDNDSVHIESEDGDKHSTPPKRWTGLTSLDKINESPESLDTSGRSGRTLQLQNANSRDASPNSLEYSDVSSGELSPDHNLENCGGDYNNFSDDEEDYSDPFDDLPPTAPSFKMYQREFKCQLDTIFEDVDEEEEID